MPGSLANVKASASAFDASATSGGRPHAVADVPAFVEEEFVQGLVSITSAVHVGLSTNGAWKSCLPGKQHEI